VKLPRLKWGWLQDAKVGDRVLVGCHSATGIQSRVTHFNQLHRRTVRVHQHKFMLVDFTGAVPCWLVTIEAIDLKEGFVEKQRGRPRKEGPCTSSSNLAPQSLSPT
jgi:hypothetical protein